MSQLLVESLILALGGALLGTLLAWGGSEIPVALMPPEHHSSRSGYPTECAGADVHVGDRRS